MDEQAHEQEVPLPDDMAALEEAVKLAGGYGALAAQIGVAASSPSMWRKRGVVPEEQGPNIEGAPCVAGKVAAERLCPAGRYVRVPDPAWPHPDGKPLLDTVRQVQPVLPA